MSTRRTFLGRALGVCSALFAERGLSAQTMQMQMPMPMPPPTPAHPQTPPPHSHSMSSSPTSVVTTDVGDLAPTMDGSTKVYNLVAEVLRPTISSPTGRDPGTKLPFRQRRSRTLPHGLAAARPSSL